MAGHSKWATIKRKKAVIDAKRGAVFTKHAKNIAVAAKNGADPEMNPALRTAIDNAKAANMPKDNIEKAVLKGSGQMPGVVYEEVRYEAYGPGGVGIIIEGVTDNTNRTVSDVRHVLGKNGGSLAESGSVLFQFSQNGVIRVSTEDMGSVDQDELELALIEAGAEDIQMEEEGMTVMTAVKELHTVSTVVEEMGLKASTVAIEWVPNHEVALEGGDAEKIENLVELLEEHDDVNTVYTNAA